MKALMQGIKNMSLSIYRFMKRIILNFLHALASEDNLFFLAGAGGIIIIGGLLTAISLPISETAAAFVFVFTAELAVMFAALYLAICMVETGVKVFLNNEDEYLGAVPATA